MAKRIRTKLTKDRVKEVIRKVPAIIRGEERKDPLGLHNKFWAAVAHSMFTSLSEAFEVKAQGGQDELGNSWHDIQPETKAYHRSVHTGDLSRSQSRAMKNPNTLGMLTPAQYRKWRRIFGSIYHQEKNKVGEEEARKLAGQVAWARLKREGADTKIRVLGNRDLLIMRDTDRLFRSFLPGKVTKNSYRKYNRDQIYEVRKGEVTLGTSVDYASEVFDDRPLWAGDLSPWIKRASAAGVKHITDYIERVMHSD